MAKRPHEGRPQGRHFLLSLVSIEPRLKLLPLLPLGGQAVPGSLNTGGFPAGSTFNLLGGRSYSEAIETEKRKYTLHNGHAQR